MSKIDSIDDHFKIPVFYNKHKLKLNDNIISDLELVDTIDPSGINIYSFAFKSNNCFSKKIINQISQYYTTDIAFLTDTQDILKKYNSLNHTYDYDNIISLWDEIKNDTGFKQKYNYVEWEMLDFLNKSEEFLRITSIYSITSPVLSLLTPLIIVIIPFCIIKMKGIRLNFKEYVDILQVIISNQPIGKLFTQFNSVKIEQKIYILISASFYLLSIYQNIAYCIKFNTNMKIIHETLFSIRKYIQHTEQTMNNFLLYSKQLSTYNQFNNTIVDNLNILCEFNTKLNKLTNYEVSFSKICEMGVILKSFYELYNDKTYNDAFLYSFGFNGYITNLEGLIENINIGKINFAKFIHKNIKNKTKIKNNYYAPLINKTPIKNNIKFSKNIIITGPNASGKTTILKSTLINVILSQQFGCGFYDSATLYPYKYIHCYLNIPDTSGRDSLFQAESRRCKEILDIIHQFKDDKHICIFDELFSGTNHTEAVISATSFMKYLVEFKNVSCLLTTHFIKVCKKLNKNVNIKNYNMHTLKTTTNKNIYTYLLKEGISEVKGGLQVLHDLNFPIEILENIENNIR
jgi:hypothetical protein